MVYPLSLLLASSNSSGNPKLDYDAPLRFRLFADCF